ncbi:hypothetical protein FHT78_005867 [Rhizobium sp. BK196]|nr:hypothetical protein [Rhizobium sp. BK196]
MQDHGQWQIAGRILLCRLIHGIHGRVDFLQPRRLLARRLDDSRDVLVDLSHLRDDLLQRLSGPANNQLIKSWISLAAFAARWASSRTSWATTANPLPASPARAASTPALSVSRFVWKAISSMTPMILVISHENCSI